MTGQVAVNSFRPPKYPGTTITGPPGVLVTQQLVVFGSSERQQWTVLDTADGHSVGVTLPATFGGQIDSAGRVVGTDDSERTTYWSAGGQRLVQHHGRQVDVPVFDAVPPLYLFQQTVAGKDGVVAVRPDGSTAWTSPNDTAAAFCNGVYLLRRHDGRW